MKTKPSKQYLEDCFNSSDGHGNFINWEYLEQLEQLEHLEEDKPIRIKTTSARLFYKGGWVNCQTDHLETNPYDLFSCDYR